MTKNKIFIRLICYKSLKMNKIIKNFHRINVYKKWVELNKIEMNDICEFINYFFNVK